MGSGGLALGSLWLSYNPIGSAAPLCDVPRIANRNRDHLLILLQVTVSYLWTIRTHTQLFSNTRTMQNIMLCALLSFIQLGAVAHTSANQWGIPVIQFTQTPFVNWRSIDDDACCSEILACSTRCLFVGYVYMKGWNRCTPQGVTKKKLLTEFWGLCGIPSRSHSYRPYTGP